MQKHGFSSLKLFSNNFYYCYIMVFYNMQALFLKVPEFFIAAKNRAPTKRSGQRG
jgi:hypothetical protein